MGCTCIKNDSGEYPDFIRITNPRARKDHKCGECNRTINTGETYEKAVGLWCGNLDTKKTCNDCLSARSAFFCGEYVYGEVWSDIYNMIDDSGDLKISDLDDLTENAREKVISLIDELIEEEEECL